MIENHGGIESAVTQPELIFAYERDRLPAERVSVGILLDHERDAISNVRYQDVPEPTDLEEWHCPPRLAADQVAKS